jgi:hypothetical protein
MKGEPEFNVDKETAYWRNLALEKIFKAHIVKQTKQLPPKTHNLLLLAEIGRVNLSKEQNDFCGRINLYNIESRYPNLFIPSPTLQKAKGYFEQTKEILEWLVRQL